MVRQASPTRTQKSTKPAARRTGKKVPKKTTARSKVTKKPAKSKTKSAASTTKKNKQTIRKNTRKTPINKAKANSKSNTSKARSKKPQRPYKLKAVASKLLKPSYSLRPLLLSVAIASVVGVFCGHQVWAKGYDNFTGAYSKQTAEAPTRISTPGPAQTNPLFSIYPTWSQNFATNKSGKLNSKYWNVFQGIEQNGNNEAEYYTGSSTNLHIKHGALSLVATHQPEPHNYHYASARIDTDKKISFLYGRIDVTAKLPNGVGTWPAVWFLPANNKYENMSPSSDSLRYLNGGEMDLIEEVGFNPNVEYGVVHTRSDLNNPDGVGAYNQIEIPNNNVTYNVYSLLWTPTSITFEVNDTPFFTYNKPAGSDYTTWSFDQPFYLILNLAVGGKWGGEDTAQFPGNGINNSALPASMNIKSIYYYPYIKAH